MVVPATTSVRVEQAGLSGAMVTTMDGSEAVVGGTLAPAAAGELVVDRAVLARELRSPAHDEAPSVIHLRSASFLPSNRNPARG